ncbi:MULTISPECIES: hypothetical protein [Bacillus cereus group]|uniref:Uncharacterized protein n=1 Tax=Bacillus thuringiensis TaxID=1428 RepID=A0A9X6ZQZ2_BACTU|nr:MULTISPECIES: hypothetical protein [Bacillus cereus group]PFJ33199.1 hypothetical protein COJ15_28570 [Bacillus thuringiensis]PGP14462.1 hypothetical protein COA01_29290 [Bacillus cereus]
MKRKKMPHLLQGEFSLLKKKIKKEYRSKLQLLKSDDVWYKIVIEGAEKDFEFLNIKDFVPTDLREMHDYISPSKEQLSFATEKYGEFTPFILVLEFLLIPLYEKAYTKAIKELEIEI